MALIRVKARDGGTVTYVDEAWLDRWPDDFDRVDEPTPEQAAGAAVPAPQASPVPAEQPETEPPARGRF